MTLERRGKGKGGVGRGEERREHGMERGSGDSEERVEEGTSRTVLTRERIALV